MFIAERVRGRTLTLRPFLHGTYPQSDPGHHHSDFTPQTRFLDAHSLGHRLRPLHQLAFINLTIVAPPRRLCPITATIYWALRGMNLSIPIPTRAMVGPSLHPQVTRQSEATRPKRVKNTPRLLNAPSALNASPEPTISGLTFERIPTNALSFAPFVAKPLRVSTTVNAMKDFIRVRRNTCVARAVLRTRLHGAADGNLQGPTR